MLLGYNLMPGHVHVYTGNGKGKTTAALGLALRAAGAGMRVFITQFAKSRRGGEHKALERFSDLVTIKQYGRKSFICGKATEEDVSLARAALAEAKDRLVSGEHELVILDEANIATYFGLITVDALLDVVKAKPIDVELVITGRNADQAVIDAADLVTEMREVKHYHQEGAKAKPGIEC